MIGASFSALQAVDVLDGFFMAQMAQMMRNPQPQKMPEAPTHKNGELFTHAEVAKSGIALPSAAERLEGKQGDLVEVMSNAASKSLEGANIPSSDARVVLQQEETKEDFAKFGPASEQRPNGDESQNNADLDLKLGRPNPSANLVRNAEVTSGL